MVPGPNEDPTGFRRWATVAGFCILAIALGAQIASGPFFAAAALAVGCYVATLTINYRWLAFALIALQPAALIVPFFPGRPFAWELCALLAWPSLMVAFLIGRARAEEFRFDRLETRAFVALGGYVLVLVTLMLSRGIGFRVLGGGDQMGGRFYVQQLVLTIVPMLLIVANLQTKSVLTAAFIGWGLASTYLISDFALIVGGSGMNVLLQFFELPTDALNFYVGYELTGMRRYQSLWFVGAAILAALWTCIPLRQIVGSRFLIGVPLMLLGLGLGLASGHRTVFVQTATTLVFLSLIQRFWTPLRTLVTIGLLTCTLAVLYATAEDLPPAVQRSISFLPGIHITGLAQDDAFATLRDRIEVLKMGLNDLPEYWLLGRGFGMPRLDRFSAEAMSDSITQQYINGLFYNGLLGSLLKTGVPGLICSLGFIWTITRACVHVLRTIRRKDVGDWTLFESFSAVICAHWFSIVLFFYTLHGDAGVWLQVFALPAGLVLVARRALHVPSNVSVQVAETHPLPTTTPVTLNPSRT